MSSEELPSCGISDNDINNTVPVSTRKVQITPNDNTQCVKCLYNVANNVKDKKITKKEKKEQKLKEENNDNSDNNNNNNNNTTKPIGKPIINFRSEQLCWECYRELILKKFKLNIVKVRECKRDAEKLLVALSGGTCSSMLLELLKQCTEGSGKAKMFLDIKCVHIDESSITPYLNHNDTIEFVKQFTTDKLGFSKIEIIPLEDILGTSTPFEERTKQLQQQFNDLSSETSKEDLLLYYRNQLLIQVAHKLDCKKVILGTSSNRLAVQLVASTSKGRGFSVPNETSVIIEQPSNDIKFYQPMRDFLLKEIFIYYRHLNILPVPVMFSILKLKPKHSINTLCEDFLHCLQDISNQTVHTLLRSVDKLISPSIDSNYNCSICSSSLTSEEIKNLEKVILDNKSKENNSNNNNDKNGCCSTKTEDSSCCSTNKVQDNNNNNNNGGGCCTTAQLPTTVNKETLCYSCKILYRDFKSTPNVAPYIKDNSKQLLTTSQLKNEIKDFLLNSDDEDENDN
ncbi:hypothetical protein RB653_007382 [Dictyostelium firmibasis]|uniref:Cytoplasmic tRNA 2-thiolation protein 2 n=1 Tax=Dictyostelium firmibasis TaxID=79012 RepID=A0AAN7YNZ1_9MYCE